MDLPALAVTATGPPRALPLIEFADLPPGGALPAPGLVDAVLAAHACPDCYPACYRLRFTPRADGCSHEGHAAAWSADTVHDPTCPGGWLAANRFGGAP